MLFRAVFKYNDPNGNLIWDGMKAYDYDCANQLTRVTVTNAVKVEYAYDGFGRRRIRQEYRWSAGGWTNTSETRYVYDGMTVLQERDGNNHPLVTYTRGLDLSGTSQGAGGIGGLLARSDTNGDAFYHADGNGNITMLINAEGTKLAQYLYDSFGNPLGMWGTLAAANTYRFSSKEIDRSTGLYYFGYRYYEPNFQRWLNPDPLGETFDLNMYRFVYNAPLNWVDVYGLWPTGAMGSENVHGNSINRMLSNLPESERAIVRSEQVEADVNQSSEFSYRHAMRDAIKKQSPSEARAVANDFVRGRLESARCAERNGNHIDALKRLGDAIHALQDSTSPKHNGFQPWDGKTHSLAAAQHGLGEDFDPGAGSQLDQATKDAYDYFTGTKSMPRDFFIYKADQDTKTYSMPNPL